MYRDLTLSVASPEMLQSLGSVLSNSNVTVENSFLPSVPNCRPRPSRPCVQTSADDGPVGPMTGGEITVCLPTDHGRSDGPCRKMEVEGVNWPIQMEKADL